MTFIAKKIASPNFSSVRRVSLSVASEVRIEAAKRQPLQQYT
jgi:hypothetical protein